MNEWSEVTLGEFVTLQRGHDLPERDRQLGKIPVMGSFGVTGSHSAARARGPGVTVGRSGASIGVVSYVVSDYWPLNTCLYVIDFHGNSPRFAYYFLKTLDLAAYNSGSAQPSLNRNFVHPIPIQLPDCEEQDRIAGLLGVLDDKIELNQRMNETLEATARLVFKDWFVDFGPTRAEAERRGPYLSPELWSTFPDALDDDDRPLGWDVVPVSRVAERRTDNVSPRKFPDDVFDLYSIPAYDKGQVPVSEKGAEIKSNKVIVPDGSVLMSKLNPEILRVWLPSVEAERRQICSTEFLVLSPREPFGRAFLYGLFTEEGFQRQLHGMVTGTSKSHQRVPPDSLLSIEIVGGGEKVLKAFEDTVWPLLARVVRNRDESRSLARLRDLLLPKLMSGEIRLKDAEKAVGAVA